jgi:hypothetical protein
MTKINSISLKTALYKTFVSLPKFDTLKYEVTITFTNHMGIGNNFCLTRKHLLDGERLIKSYLNFISRHVNYGMQVDAIATPEFEDGNGNITPLHYHCLISIDNKDFIRFWRFTSKFTQKEGLRHFGSPINYHISEIRNSEAYLTYTLKTIDDEYPLDRIILWGDLDEGREPLERLPAGARWKAPEVNNAKGPSLLLRPL